MSILEQVAQLPKFGVDTPFYTADDLDPDDGVYSSRDYNAYEGDLVNIDAGFMDLMETRPRRDSRVYPNTGLSTRARTPGEDRAERSAVTEFRNNAEWIRQMGLEDTYNRDMAVANNEVFPGSMATFTDGLFDFLQAGNFATATGVDEFFDHYNRTGGDFFDSAYEGFKQAAIEFSDAFTPDFYTDGRARKMVFGDVLRDHFGFEDSENQMFYESGTAVAGLFLDIFLDPLTYTGYGLGKSLRMFRGISPVQHAERYIKHTAPGRAFRAKFVPKSLLKGLQEGENAEDIAAFMNGRLKEGGTPITADEVKESAAEVLASLGTREQTIQMEEQLLQQELVNLFSGFNNAELRLMGTYMLDQPNFGKVIREQLNISDKQKQRMEDAVGTFRKTLDKWFNNEVSVGLLSENQMRSNYAMALATQTGESKALFELMARIRFGSLSGKFMDDIAPGYSVGTKNGIAFFEKEKGYPTLISRMLDGINTESNIALSGSKRGIESIRRINTKKLFDTVLSDDRIAMKIDDGIARDRFHPLHDDLKKYGMKMWSGPVGDLGDTVTYALPEALVDHLDEANKVFSDPSELNGFWKGFKDVQNIWKSYALMSPGYHMRNMYSNVFNNAIAGVKNPKQYAAGMVMQVEDTSKLPWSVRSMVEFILGGHKTLDTIKFPGKDPDTGEQVMLTGRELKDAGMAQGIGAGGLYAHEGPATVESELLRQFGGVLRTPDGFDIKTMEDTWGKTADRRREMANMIRKAAPQVTDKQALDTASIYDTIAARWALQRGLTPKDFYRENLSEILPGLPPGLELDEPSRNLLFDKLEMGEFYNRVQRHIDTQFERHASQSKKPMNAQTLLDSLQTTKMKGEKEVSISRPFKQRDVDWTGVQKFLERRIDDWTEHKEAWNNLSDAERANSKAPTKVPHVDRAAVNAWLSSKEGFKKGRITTRLKNGRGQEGWESATIDAALKAVTRKYGSKGKPRITTPTVGKVLEDKTAISTREQLQHRVDEIDGEISSIRNEAGPTYDGSAQEGAYDEGGVFVPDDPDSFDAYQQTMKDDDAHEAIERAFVWGDDIYAEGIENGRGLDELALTGLNDGFEETVIGGLSKELQNDPQFVSDLYAINDLRKERFLLLEDVRLGPGWRKNNIETSSPEALRKWELKREKDRADGTAAYFELKGWEHTGKGNLSIERTSQVDPDEFMGYSKPEEEQVKGLDEWFEVYFDSTLDAHAPHQRLIIRSEEELESWLNANRPKPIVNHPDAIDDFPGGENYDEWLIMWEPGERTIKNGNAVETIAEQSYSKAGGGGEDISLHEAHFSKLKGDDRPSNVIAHARTKDYIDENGDRTLVILELQSDWSQKLGRPISDELETAGEFLPLYGLNHKYFRDSHGAEQAFLKNNVDPDSANNKKATTAPYTWDTLPKEERVFKGEMWVNKEKKVIEDFYRLEAPHEIKHLHSTKQNPLYDIEWRLFKNKDLDGNLIPRNEQEMTSVWSLNGKGMRDASTPQQAREYAMDMINKKRYEFSVPDSPFHDDKAWVEVAAKHIAREATSRKYDRIAWLRSEDQIRRMEQWGRDAHQDQVSTVLRNALSNSQSLVKMFNGLSRDMEWGNTVELTRIPVERTPFTPTRRGTDLDPETGFAKVDHQPLSVRMARRSKGVTDAEQAAIIRQTKSYGNRFKRDIPIKVLNDAIDATWDMRSRYKRGTKIHKQSGEVDADAHKTDSMDKIKDKALYQEIQEAADEEVQIALRKQTESLEELESRYGKRGESKWEVSSSREGGAEDQYLKILRETDDELERVADGLDEILLAEFDFIPEEMMYGSMLTENQKNQIKAAAERVFQDQHVEFSFDNMARNAATGTRGLTINLQQLMDELGSNTKLKSRLEDNLWTIPRDLHYGIDDDYGLISGMVNSISLKPWRAQPHKGIPLMQREKPSIRMRTESDILYQKGRHPSAYAIDGYGSGMKALSADQRRAYDKLSPSQQEQVRKAQKKARELRHKQGYGVDTEYIPGGDSLYNYRKSLISKPDNTMLQPARVRIAVAEIIEEMPDTYKGINVTRPGYATDVQDRIGLFYSRLDDHIDSGQLVRSKSVTDFLSINFNKILEDQGYTFKELKDLGTHTSKSDDVEKAVGDHIKYYDGEEWNPVVVNRAFIEKIISDDELLKSKSTFTPENRRAISHALRGYAEVNKLARFDTWTTKQFDTFIRLLLKTRQRDAGKQSQVREFFKQNFKHTTEEPPLTVSSDVEIADEAWRQQMAALSRIPESSEYTQQLQDLRALENSDLDLKSDVIEKIQQRIEDLQVGQITKHNEIFPSTTVRDAQLLPTYQGKKTFDIPSSFNLTALKRFKKNKTWWEALVPSEQKRINNSIKELEDLKSKGHYEEVKKKIRGKQHTIGKLTSKGYLVQRQKGDDILGAVEFTDDEIVPFRAQGTAVMYAAEGANPSTFIHEMGHIIRRFLIDEGDELAINRWVFGEKEALIARKTGVPLEWGVDEEEKFAEALENLVIKGIKPHGALKVLEGPFERLQVNLQEVYKDIKKSGAQFDGNVEEVMRRVLGRGTEPNPEELLTAKALIQSSQKKYQKKYGLEVPIKERIKAATGGPVIKGRNLVQWNQAIGHAFENNARWAHFIQKWQDGNSFEEAGQSVKRFLFDYNELTPFERDVMKTIIPFYTWMRKNIPLQIEMLIERPEFYAKIPKFMEEVEGMSNALADDNGKIPTPDYFDEVNAMRLPWQNDGQPVYLSQDLPFQDLNRLNYKDMLSQMSPFLKIWGALAIDKGYDFFLESPIEQFAGEPAVIDLFGEPSELPISKKMEYAIKTMVPPAGKALRFLDKAAQGRAEDQLFREALGLSVTSVDVDAIVRSQRYKRKEVSSLLRRKVRRRIQRFGLEEGLKKSGSRLVN